MKIPLQTLFRNTDGAIMTKSGAPASPEKPEDYVTMRDVCIVALTTEFPEDQQNPGNIVEDKLKRFALYQKFLLAPAAAETLDLELDACQYLRPRVARCFAVLVSGPAMLILSGSSEVPQ